MLQFIKPTIVQEHSMENTLKPNDYLFISKQSYRLFGDPQRGDIIVFHSDEAGDTPVTHRVVENRVANGEIITKGDANEQNDASPVTYANVLGKLVLHVPMLGYLAAPIATTMGKVAMGCVILAAYILTVVGGKLKGK